MKIGETRRPDASLLGRAATSRNVHVTQERLETDPTLLAQLLTTGRVGDARWYGVVESYAVDLRASPSIQPPLFEAMLPHLWGAWQETLLFDVCRDATSTFNSALFHRPNLIAEVIDPATQRQVEVFVRDSLILASDAEEVSKADLRWVPFWTSAVSWWPSMMAEVWDRLSDGPRVGHALSILVYLSRFAYRDAENPLIAEASRLAPLWAQASFDSALHWSPEAIAAFSDRLEWSRVEGYLRAAVAGLATDARSEELQLVASDIQENRRDLFLKRRSVLLRHLSSGGLDRFWDDEIGID